MQINFFEEYPNEDTLSKLKLINFETKLYIAAKNVSQFLKYKREILSRFRKVKEVIYWPVLEEKEGYWISAFSKKEALLKIFNEIEGSSEVFGVLLDLEVPMKCKSLFFTQIGNIIFNRKLIIKFVKNSKHHIVVAQLPFYDFRKYLMNFAGINFSFSNYHRIDMVYTSFVKQVDYLKNILGMSNGMYKDYSIGLGVIAIGEDNKTLPLLKSEDLRKDLEILRDRKIKEAILYRLGGLNKDYIKVIQDFID
jgi:hypothetical protein